MSEITWKGKQVPWVTRWTGEVPQPDENAMHAEDDGYGGIRLVWNLDPDNEEREASGILWQREGLMRGGEPQFAQVSTYRQRAAMRKRLCQVCGQRIDEPVIDWLMAPGHMDISPEGDLISMNPPTCQTCVQTALEKCPHLLRAGHQVLRVLEYELYGVYGEAFLFNPERNATSRLNALTVKYGLTPEEMPPYLSYGAFVAKQQVVKFTKFKLLS